MTERRILAIAGSLRRHSFNRRLLELGAHCAPSSLRICIDDGLHDIPLFDGDLDDDTSGGPAAVRRLRRAVAQADGLLIATPEYNQSLPGVLKNAIDWLSRPGPDEVLIGKPVAILGASSGPWGTRLAQQSLRHVLTAAEARVMPVPMLFVRHAAEVLGTGAAPPEALQASLEKLLRAFDDWIDRMCSQVGGAPVDEP